jgi:hypothetical protein
LTIPLLSLPYLLESFTPATEPLDIYTAATCLPVNHPEGPSSYYSSLGFSSGRIIAQSLLTGNTSNLHDTMRSFLEEQPHQANGDQLSGEQQGFVNLIRNRHNGERSSVLREVIALVPTIRLNDQALIESMTLPSSGWENPYPAV